MSVCRSARRILSSAQWRASVACAIALATVFARVAAAERLSFTTYTAAQGLAGDRVTTAVEDARGFLWIGTDKGLSRFDGIEFRTFDRRNGLAKEDVTSIAISRDGTMWIGVWGAAYRFDGRTFTEMHAEGPHSPWERVHVAIDTQDRVWFGADALYRVAPDPKGAPALHKVPDVPTDHLQPIDALLADREGNLWVGTAALHRLDSSGHVSRVDATRAGAGPGHVLWLAQVPSGRVVAATPGGVQYVGACAPGSPRPCLFPWLADLPVGRAYQILPKEDGGLWIGTNDGLMETDAAGTPVRHISRAHGLVPSLCWPVLIDRSGDLWIGSDSGVQRLAGTAFSVFGLTEGLEATQIAAIFGTLSGDVVVDATPQVLQRFEGTRFVATRPVRPRDVEGPSWGWYQLDLQDHTGQWWIPTASGVVRFTAAVRPEDLARKRPLAVYTSAGCFRGRDVFRLYEDTRGDIWMSTVERAHEALYRWNRSSGVFDCFDPAAIVGLRVSPTAFLDDGRGTLWIGFGHGQVARYRGGRFECVMDCGPGTHGLVHALLLDRQRRLWIATGKAGVFRIDRPEDRNLTPIAFTTERGLTSDVARALAEDRFGRMYVGTDRGVDVLGGEDTPVRHFGTSDGLPHPHVTSAWTDRRGDVWFGTLNGVARFSPPARFRDPGVARVFLGGVRVSGIPQPLTATGQERLDGLVLAPDQRELEIDVMGLPRMAAAGLQFQYRRSPDDRWSPASSGRSLILAGLSAGTYRAEIRAIGSNGTPSSNTVVVTFRVLAPVYRRPWFAALAAAALLAFVSASYRVRVAHLVALERQRAHIAMDLHDEMGSRLGSIGLLADVAAERCRGSGEQSRLLDEISEVASEMGASLSDIVWSLRDEELTIESLARHLAERGRHMFPDPGRVFETDFPSAWPNVRMTPGARRNAFLIALEALHNAARHSRAPHVTLRLRPAGRQWQITVTDNGTGIENAAASASHASGFGLDGMKQRAAEIGATLDIRSQAGKGTTVSLVFSPRSESHRAAFI